MAKMKKQKGPKRKMTRMEKREAIAGYLYLLPNFIGFVIFTGIPIFLGLLISFTNYNGFKWKFVGSQSGYSQSASLLAHNRAAASQLIRSGLYHS